MVKITFGGLVIAFILAGLFFYSMISFGVNLGRDNNANQSILNDTAISETYFEIEGNLSDVKTSAQSAKTSLEEEDPRSDEGSLVFKAITSSLKTVGNSLSFFYGSITYLVGSTLGVPAIVITSMTAIMFIVVAFLFWRVIKTGN